jgi:hypothetical protein
MEVVKLLFDAIDSDNSGTLDMKEVKSFLVMIF